MTGDPRADVTLLNELEAARAAATPGPWTERQDFIDQGVPDNSKTLNGPDGSYLGTIALSYRGENNAAAIVAAVNAVGPMVTALREFAELEASYPLGSDVPVYRIGRILAQLESALGGAAK